MTDQAAPLVSVIIPAYNAAATLDATLRSARGQSYATLEIIVVDDGSRDETAAVAQRHADEDARVRVLRKPNGGVSDARNHGIRASRGALLAPLDSDDLWRSTKIEKQVAAWRAAGPGVAFVYCLSHMIDLDDRVVGTVGWAGFDGHVFLRSVLANFVANGSVMLVSREAALRVGGYDPTRAMQGTEDRLFQSLLARVGRVVGIPEYLVGYRQTPGSVSGDPVRMLRAQLCCIERLAAAAPDTPPALLAAAEATARVRLAMRLARKGAPGAAAAEALRAARLSPLVAADVVARDVVRPLRKAWFRRRAPAAPAFHEADVSRSCHPIDPLPVPWLLRRLARAEEAHARTPLRRGDGDALPLADLATPGG